MKSVLVIRFSSMGDVALLAPVLKAAVEAHSKTKFTLLTKSTFAPILSPIANLNIVCLESFYKYKPFVLVQLFWFLLRQVRPDLILDLHISLRSVLLSTFFLFSGKHIYAIDKGKREKYQMTRRKNKAIKPLKRTTERYREVFLKAEIQLSPTDIRPYAIPKIGIPKAKKIGIAPIAKYAEKTYPLSLMREVIERLTSQSYIIYLFGSTDQRQALDSLTLNKEVINTAGQYSLAEEFELMQTLSLMVSMDSANMHLAAWVGIPTLSIWGATHPFLGFSPFHQKTTEIVIQNETLHCRPCSVFGNQKCFKKNWECLHSIRPKEIVQKVMQFINSPKKQ